MDYRVMLMLFRASQNFKQQLVLFQMGMLCEIFVRFVHNKVVSHSRHQLWPLTFLGSVQTLKKRGLRNALGLNLEEANAAHKSRLSFTYMQVLFCLCSTFCLWLASMSLEVCYTVCADTQWHGYTRACGAHSPLGYSFGVLPTCSGIRIFLGQEFQSVKNFFTARV